MKNRLLAMLLAAIMIVCSMSLVSFADEGDTFEFTNTNPEYLTVGANSHTSLYPGTYTTQTEGGATGITFWFNVKNLSAPVYLYGAMMDFTTADGASFGSGSTGFSRFLLWLHRFSPFSRSACLLRYLANQP